MSTRRESRIKELHEVLGHHLRHHVIDRAAKASHLFHHGAAQETVARGCGQKNSLEGFVEGAIGVSDLKLVLEITRRAGP